MVKSLNTSVIILGGSIVGLSNALFLAQRGVSCILIERHPGSSPHPRAMGWTHRTMELFRTVDGLEAELKAFPSRAGGKPRRVMTRTLNGKWDEESHWTTTNNEQGAGSKGGPAGKGPTPTDFSSATPVEALGIAQDKLEPILRAKAISLGADLRLGYTMTDWSLNDDDSNHSVSLTATNSTTGETLRVMSSYLIACDGANSRIRADLGIGTSGVGHLRTMYSTLFRCPSIEHQLASGVSQWSIKNDDLEAFLVTYQEGRWALMASNPAHDSPNDDERKTLIRQAIGDGEIDIEILAHGTWALRGAIADAFADKTNRVFLAGDAAHALPPNRGGYGANTGVADAHNLAWKLAAVLAGRSDATLLRTYEAERRPVALVRHDQIFARADYREYVAGSAWLEERRRSGKGDIEVLGDVAMELGQIYRSGAVMAGEDEGGELALAKTPAEWRGQSGTRAPHIWLKKEGEVVSSLDLLCGGWVLLSKDGSWKERLGGVKGVKYVHVGHDVEEADQGAFEGAFGIGKTGAVLIRPDGYIGARWKESTSLGDVKQVHKLVRYAFS
ncbi:hypothetical protein PG985_014011 [Apiospora marii]|uniref:uncharacterized protein n=1 Tax=Apiospora marii TaxID=335849 RepID=UPI00312EFB1D